MLLSRGRDGLDGDDGDPGPPGRPGRDGKDGKPGRDGRHGKDGSPGKDGKPGRDGIGIQGKAGDRGPPGPRGPAGPAPEHEWQDTKLRFKKPDGDWGKAVDLKGPPGRAGAIVSIPGSGEGSGDFQPLDSDLTAIAALNTTSFGRSLLTVADAEAGRDLLEVGAGVASEWGDITGTLADQTDLQTALDAKQPLDSDLTAIAALSTTAYGRALLELANQAALQSAVGITQYTDEMAQDAAGAMVSGNTEDGVTATYDDGANKINFANTDKGSTAVSDHEAAGNPHPQYLTEAEADALYEPLGGYTDEEAQDAVGGILSDSGDIDFTYDDATPAISGAVKADAVGNTKLANMAQATIKGRQAGSGTGDPEDLTASQARTALGLGTAALSNTGDFDAAGSAAAAQAASQPLDSDLTAIAALTTTAYGRGLLTLANQAALQAEAGGGAAAGMQVGYATTSTTTTATSTAQIALDNSIPQSNEGSAFANTDTAYTPLYSNSLIEIEFAASIGSDTSQIAAIALFKDAGADALVAVAAGVGTSVNVYNTVCLKFVEAAGSTAARTYKIRFGRSGASGTVFMNRGPVALFGAATIARMTVREIKQ